MTKRTLHQIGAAEQINKMTGFNINRFLAHMLTFFTLAGGPAIATGSPGAAPAHTPPPPWAGALIQKMSALERTVHEQAHTIEAQQRRLAVVEARLDDAAAPGNGSSSAPCGGNEGRKTYVYNRSSSIEVLMANHSARLAVLEDNLCANLSSAGSARQRRRRTEDGDHSNGNQGIHLKNLKPVHKIIRKACTPGNHKCLPKTTGRRRLQHGNAQKCTQATMSTRNKAVDQKCCDEKAEDCSSGGAQHTQFLALLLFSLSVLVVRLTHLHACRCVQFLPSAMPTVRRFSSHTGPTASIC